MSRRQQIYRALSAVIEASDRWLVVHSSLAGLRLHPAGLKWDLLAALAQLAQEGRTLAVPTFTFAFCEKGNYHHRRSQSETGRLGDWMLELAGSLRTPHPIYSFAVLGPESREALTAHNSTTFGDDSIFALFEARNARLTMLGCEWRFCTQFHRYEEERRVAYRHFKDFSGWADYGEGPHHTTARMFVRDLELGADTDFSAAVERLRTENHVVAQGLGGGRVETVLCHDLACVCRDLLRDDELAFVANRAVAARSMERRWGRRPPVKIALLGHSNLQLVKDALVEQAGHFSAERPVEVCSTSYGQVLGEMLVDDSTLNRFDAEVTICLDRIEDLCQVATLDARQGRDQLEQRLDQFVAALRHYAGSHAGRLFVARFGNTQPSALGAFDAIADDGVTALVARGNARLEAGLADLPSVVLFDPWSTGWCGRPGAIVDPRLWFLGRFPFSGPFSQELARRAWGLVLAALGETARLIVVDLDDTLWRGTLGEDGLERLQVGGDYPGNAFAHFQSTLKMLSRRGVALAMCSKNDEHRVLDAFRQLESMVLQEDDFVARRVNWRPKCQNVAEIAAELGLDLRHVLFVDNDPVERERIRERLPKVRVLDLPADPALFADTLLRSPYLECLTVTAEDERRTENYRSRLQRLEHAESFGCRADWIASLDARVDVAPLTLANTARAEQLMLKTNQFNTTTRRYDRRQLEQLAEKGSGVFVVGAEDRFSAREEIGVVVVRWHQPCPVSAEIDSLLLSCRMLARGVETPCWPGSASRPPSDPSSVWSG